jgi:hypothetical protein
LLDFAAPGASIFRLRSFAGKRNHQAHGKDLCGVAAPRLLVYTI